MDERQVDLERLALAYDHRMETFAAVRAGEAAAAVPLSTGDLAIDVGGGRGAHGAVFAAAGARALVVDRSPDMARQALLRGVPAVVGDAGRLPIGDASAALVYYHLSIHHGPALRWLDEAVRVAAPGGLVWVWTLATAHHRSSFLAGWFPSVGPLDEERFPDPTGLAAHLAGRGLGEVTVTDRHDEVVRTAGSWETAVRAGFVSTLHLVDPVELATGLEAFRRAHPDPDEPIRYTLHFARVSGRLLRPVS